MQRSEVWSVSDLAACVASVPEKVEITGIGLVGLKGDVKVQGGLRFGGDPTESVAPKPLSNDYVAPTDFTVSMLHPVPCGPTSARGSWLWVGITATAVGHWDATGVYLEYRADGRDYRTEWEFGMSICAVGDDPSSDCQGRPTTPVR